MDYILSPSEVNALNSATDKERDKLKTVADELKKLASHLDINIVLPDTTKLEWVPSTKLGADSMIVSGEQYDTISVQPQKIRQFVNDENNKVCMQIATTIPIKFWGRDEASVWGCPHAKCPDCGDDASWCDCDSDASYDAYSEYCDECPAKKVCTLDKTWSQ